MHQVAEAVRVVQEDFLPMVHQEVIGVVNSDTVSFLEQRLVGFLNQERVKEDLVGVLARTRIILVVVQVEVTRVVQHLYTELTTKAVAVVPLTMEQTP
jgi:hypothetical protein